MAEHPPFRRAANLSRPGIHHGFFGRRGGVSTGIFASLNCGLGSADVRDNALENRRRAAAALGADRLLTVYQHHSALAVTVTEPWPIEAPPRADAMVTAQSGIALGILAADCAPVLFVDEAAGVIGAAHAGWRGAVDGVLEATLATMEHQGARRANVVAAIGPVIGQGSYEVGAEFKTRFRDVDGAYGHFFASSERHGHFLFDLPAFVRHRLIAAGVPLVETISACTYRDEADYFSYRRATHRHEPDYGRNLSAILLLK
jgi:hypothetical protein